VNRRRSCPWRSAISCSSGIALAWSRNRHEAEIDWCIDPTPRRRTIMNKALLALAALACMASLPTLAQEDAPTTAPSPQAASAALTLILESQGDIERRTMLYQCDDEQTLG